MGKFAAARAGLKKARNTARGAGNVIDTLMVAQTAKHGMENFKGADFNNPEQMQARMQAMAESEESSLSGRLRTEVNDRVLKPFYEKLDLENRLIEPMKDKAKGYIEENYGDMRSFVDAVEKKVPAVKAVEDKATSETNNYIHQNFSEEEIEMAKKCFAQTRPQN